MTFVVIEEMEPARFWRAGGQPQRRPAPGGSAEEADPGREAAADRRLGCGRRRRCRRLRVQLPSTPARDEEAQEEKEEGPNQ